VTTSCGIVSLLEDIVEDLVHTLSLLVVFGGAISLYGLPVAARGGVSFDSRRT
jgi:hypothetical protein